MNVPYADWSFPGNMARYEGKANIVYSTGDGIYEDGGWKRNGLSASVTLHETLVARVNYPIATGAWPTHGTIGKHGGQSTCMAALMCIGPTPNVTPMPADSSPNDPLDLDSRKRRSGGNLAPGSRAVGGIGGSGGMVKHK